MARLNPQFVPAAELSAADIAAIVQIGQRQADLMNELEHALDVADTLRALDIARQLVALEGEVTRH
jgi:hypothetical protein